MCFNALLFFLLLITRLVGLTWGGGNFFHPDENNMAWAIERFSWPKLQPQFFAYGQLPLYLAYFTYQTWSFITGERVFKTPSFAEAIYLLRFWSAIFSITTVIIGWLLAEKIFPEKKWVRVYVLLLIFSPGLIQMAHFGTTESVLTFVALALGYLSVNYNLLGLALISAIGLATKLSAALFLAAPIIAILLGKGSLKKKVKELIFWLMLTLFLTVIFSPYNFLDFQEFIRVIRYESGVAWGRIPVFYTRQFIETKPIIFQLTKIFPWILGRPLFIFLLIGLIISGLRMVNLFFFQKRKIFSFNSKFFILNSIFWPWFLFNGFLFVKWTRFMTPILPFLILLAVSFWRRLGIWLQKKNKRQLFLVISSLFLFFFIFPGIIFLKIYFSPDIRYRATIWLNENLPRRAIILSEAGNVVDLPLFNDQNFKIINFDFYSLDDRLIRWQRLEELVNEADYILLPSRRVFANHLPLPDQFPRTAKFYQQLFSGELGFKLVKIFRPLPLWAEIFLGNDLNSEETWTVFDHPTIRLFAKIKPK